MQACKGQTFQHELNLAFYSLSMLLTGMGESNGDFLSNTQEEMVTDCLPDVWIVTVTVSKRFLPRDQTITCLSRNRTFSFKEEQNC